MRISSAEEYGLRCLISIARQGEKGHISIPEIAELEGLSTAYTSKLLSILKKAGLVKAVRGRKGGFCITRPPKEISLLDVLTVLGGPFLEPDHCAHFTGQLERCVHGDNCSVHDVLDALAAHLEQFLTRTSLQDIIDQQNPTPKASSPSSFIPSGNVPSAGKSKDDNHNGLDKQTIMIEG